MPAISGEPDLFGEIDLFFIPLPLGEKGPFDFTTVSVSVGKRVLPKTAHRIFLNFS